MNDCLGNRLNNDSENVGKVSISLLRALVLQKYFLYNPDQPFKSICYCSFFKYPAKVHQLMSYLVPRGNVKMRQNTFKTVVLNLSLMVRTFNKVPHVW